MSNSSSEVRIIFMTGGEFEEPYGRNLDYMPRETDEEKQQEGTEQNGSGWMRAKSLHGGHGLFPVLKMGLWTDTVVFFRRRGIVIVPG